MRLGCIGVGSNAIRLLSAQWEGGRLCGDLRERRGTRLFAGLHGGMLTAQSMDASVAAVLATVNGEKVTFLAVCGKDAIAKGIKAGDLVKQVCTACGGSGGGKPDSAMGGGKDATKVDNALALVDDFVASKLN